MLMLVSLVSKQHSDCISPLCLLKIRDGTIPLMSESVGCDCFFLYVMLNYSHDL